MPDLERMVQLDSTPGIAFLSIGPPAADAAGEEKYSMLRAPGRV